MRLSKNNKKVSIYASPIWHPCSQMHDYVLYPPIRITGAKNSHLYTEDGSFLIDAISSWWCKPLGHGHPRLIEALIKQSKAFEHVILANTTSNLIEELSAKLTELSPNHTRIFYAGDGSTACEIALKMSCQYQRLNGQPNRTKFAYLSQAYHGETILTYSVSDLKLYKEPFAHLCPKNIRLPKHKNLTGPDDINWKNDLSSWKKIELCLEKNKHQLAAVIVEPIIQGAAGMLMYSPALLANLRKWTSKNHVLLIADEIMTGLGRTGKAFACEHSKIIADIVCIMKNLNGGFTPFSACLIRENIYLAFYDEYKKNKAFWHSNTFTGNALGAATSLETLKIYQEENWFEKVNQRSSKLRKILERLQAKTQCLSNIRSLGFVAAADVSPSKISRSKSNKKPNSPTRIGHQIYRAALKHHVFIRPLGDTIYLLPPFNITDEDLEILENGIEKAIAHVLL